MVTKLVDYCKSFPVRCKSAGIYADSETGIRLKYDKESNSFLQDKKNGKVTRVNKKLLKPLFTYAVDFSSKTVTANVYSANSISKHGLNWNLIFSSEFSLSNMCYTEQGEGSAKYWFNQEKNFDVAERITYFSEPNAVYFKDYLNSFLNAIPFGERVRKTLPALDIFLLLEFLYSGEYKKLV